MALSRVGKHLFSCISFASTGFALMPENLGLAHTPKNAVDAHMGHGARPAASGSDTTNAMPS